MQQMRPLLLKIFFLLLTFFVMASNFYVMDIKERNITAKEGWLDLSQYNLEKQGKLNLDGEWQFFYNRLITPMKYSELKVSESPDFYIKPPTVWNDYKMNGKPIPGFGYGTYRMIVTGVRPGIPLAIKMLPQSTAYDLYIDDERMADNGVVAKDKSHSATGYHPRSIAFTPKSAEFVITIHISNYEFARGGIWDAPTLGTAAQIGWLDRFILYRDLFLQGVYFIVFLLFLTMFLNRPGNRSWLYFSLLCVVIAARLLIYGEILLSQFTENIRLIAFIEYNTRLWFPVLMLLMLNAELSGRLPKKVLSGLTITVLTITVLSAILPVHVISAFTKPIMVYDVGSGLAMLIMLFWPGERFFSKNKSKVFFIYGILAIFICMTYDMFLSSTEYVEMTPIGFFAAVLAFAFVLAITYTDAIAQNEKALRELEIESERKLQTELSLLQSQIRPHFLFNALSAIANVCAKDGKKAEQLILDLAYFMQASFDFSPGAKLTTLENELEYIRKYVHIEKARFGEKVRYEEQIEVPLNLLLPRLIIEPLVENAIRHGISRKKGGGEVRLRICEAPESIRVEVFDNGVGIPKEKLSDVTSEESRGVGLKNIQDRLIRSGGTGLSIESEQDGYTRVSFTIKREE